MYQYEPFFQAVSLDDSDVTVWYHIGKVAMKTFDLFLARRAFEEVRYRTNFVEKLSHSNCYALYENSYSICLLLQCTVLHCTALNCTVLCCTVLCHTVLCCAVLHCTATCSALHCTVLLCSVLCCVQQSCTV